MTNLSLLDIRFTKYFCRAQRVEVDLKEGYEDYTGYGSRKCGRVQRFYVGISGGRTPVYMQRFRKDSTVGSRILSDSIENIRGLDVFQHSKIATRHYNYLYNMGYDFSHLN